MYIGKLYDLKIDPETGFDSVLLLQELSYVVIILRWRIF